MGQCVDFIISGRDVALRDLNGLVCRSWGRVLRVALVHAFVGSILELDIEKLTLRSFVGEGIVREVCGPEVDQEWLIDELGAHIEMQLGKLEPSLSEGAFHVYLVIRHRLQEGSSIAFRYANFDCEAIISVLHLLKLGLFHKDLEGTLGPRGELDDIISIVVSHVMLGYMEISRFELFMVRDLVQVVRVVRDVALLLEDAASVLHQVVSLVHLLLPLLFVLAKIHTGLLGRYLLLLVQGVIVVNDTLRVSQP